MDDPKVINVTYDGLEKVTFPCVVIADEQYIYRVPVDVYYRCVRYWEEKERPKEWGKKTKKWWWQRG